MDIEHRGYPACHNVDAVDRPGLGRAVDALIAVLAEKICGEAHGQHPFLVQLHIPLWLRISDTCRPHGAVRASGQQYASIKQIHDLVRLRAGVDRPLLALGSGCVSCLGKQVCVAALIDITRVPAQASTIGQYDWSC